MSKLHIARGLDLPLDAVTQTFGAIGRKGAGKTYLATMLAEQMLDAGAQVVALDPVGNWWGLRVGADGTSPGKDIFVIGGEHGDVPLVPEAGARIARLLVERRVSAVLDVSGFRLGERKRFAADFGEEFLHLKKSRKTPVHLFIEEAQLIIPQRVGPEEARMVGAFEQLVRLGRNYGVGCTLVTQRPQSVNKEVLSQVECLCVLQVTGPHERKALEEWVQEVGADRKLVGELPGLSRGEGFVWSPAWLRLFKRVHFASKRTFDASATPEVGRAEKAANLSAVDVEALKADMADVVAKATAEDPKALQRRVRELEAELKKPRELAVDTKALERARNDGVMTAARELGRAEAMRRRTADDLRKLGDRAHQDADTVAQELRKIGSLLHNAAAALAEGTPPFDHLTKPAPVAARAHAPAVHHAPRPVVVSSNGLPTMHRKFLTALAQHPDGLSKAQVLTHTTYASSGPTSAAFAELARDGLIAVDRNMVTITDAGLGKLGPFEPLPVGVELREHLLRTLPKMEATLLGVVFEHHPATVGKGEILNRAGYSSSGPTSAAFARLTRLGYVVRRGNGLHAAPEMFE